MFRYDPDTHPNVECLNTTPTFTPRGRFQLCLKLILRDLLPGNRPIVRQIVGGPIGQRSLVGAARLSVPNGAIGDAPILRHRLMLKSRPRQSSSSDVNKLSAFRNCSLLAPSSTLPASLDDTTPFLIFDLDAVVLYDMIKAAEV